MIHRAMVLAAGRGTRLAPLTDRLPKPLMPVAGRPMIVHILELLRCGGIDDVVINLHHLGHLIEREIRDGAGLGLRVRYSWEPEILDTGGGIKRAQPLLGDEPFIVANGDSLLELSLHDLVEAHRAGRGIATMVVRPTPDAARWGLVELDSGDRVRRVAGLPAGLAKVAPLRPFMFPGLHVFEPRVFDYMRPGAAFSITRETYPAMLTAGETICGFVTRGRWLTIDTPEELHAADRTMTLAPFRF
jgi:NDP-sugar pyrophosphorylase family protein